MNFSLTPELEKYIDQKVKSGLYNSASEVVREGLRLLRERDQITATRLADLRMKIAEGLAQLDRGESVKPEEVRARIRERSKARRQK